MLSIFTLETAIRPNVFAIMKINVPMIAADIVNLVIFSPNEIVNMAATYTHQPSVNPR